MKDNSNNMGDTGSFGNFYPPYGLQDLGTPLPHREDSRLAAPAWMHQDQELTHLREAQRRQASLVHQGSLFPSEANIQYNTPPSTTTSRTDRTTTTPLQSYNHNNTLSFGPHPSEDSHQYNPLPSNGFHTETSPFTTGLQSFSQSNMTTYMPIQASSQRQLQPSALPQLNCDRITQFPSHIQEHEFGQDSTGLMTPLSQMGTPSPSSRSASIDMDNTSYSAPPSSYQLSSVNMDYFSDRQPQTFESHQQHHYSPVSRSPPTGVRSPGKS